MSCEKTILTKRSLVAGEVPAIDDLINGEFAINVPDGIIYSKSINGDIVAWTHDYTAVVNIDPKIEYKSSSNWSYTEDANNVFDGTSDNINDNESASITFTANVDFEFDWAVSSEANYDYLTVTVDGIELLHYAGENNGHEVVSVSQGTIVEIIFKYEKDYSVSQGTDDASFSNLKVI